MTVMTVISLGVGALGLASLIGSIAWVNARFNGDPYNTGTALSLLIGG